MYQFVFYVPKSHADLVKDAVFKAGAGRIGDYDRCCWQVEGIGQFRPLAGSQPFLGAEGEEEQVPELRVEMVVSHELMEPVRAALLAAHPYEEPAYSIWPLVTLPRGTE
ncbi:hypothetical protein P886_2840 [Alteromonadaceae bacterium 2753L.S.0a.02]|nr:hypothetical protein P886_2840 [Alteromonadaceae bacterium 2753L.S.0a.02]